MCVEINRKGILTKAVCGGFEIVEARHLTHAFRPHRHDSYVVGLTRQGVQCFGYRGERRSSNPGNAFVIHPNEVHDGYPGTDSGYGYRAVYISPDLILEALENGPMPFVGEAVGTDLSLISALEGIFEAGPDLADSLTVAGCIARLADVLREMSDAPCKSTSLGSRRMARRIRDDLREHAVAGIAMKDLEARHGLNRFTITRLFRRHFGVCPHRYLILRRVEHARRRIETGSSLSDAAYAAGFADQSHMTRHFVRTYGLSPGNWKRLLA